MSIDKQYVDSHGQSEVGFAFCRLLGFQLLPRLKGIHRQKLYIPEAGAVERYPNLRYYRWSRLSAMPRTVRPATVPESGMSMTAGSRATDVA